jgi:hypothetical protein
MVQVWYQSQDFLGIGQVIAKGDQKLLLPKIVI